MKPAVQADRRELVSQIGQRPFRLVAAGKCRSRFQSLIEMGARRESLRPNCTSTGAFSAARLSGCRVVNFFEQRQNLPGADLSTVRCSECAGTVVGRRIADLLHCEHGILLSCAS
jgi:hypothetical protein